MSLLRETEMKTLRVIYHYLKNDPDFSYNCYAVAFIVDGKLTAVELVQRAIYPYRLAKCFVEGVRMATPNCQITEEKVADLE
jgi:hypothetical protein